MQELFGSMVRFSTALTVFGLQQMRNAVSEVVSSPMSLDRLREAMDSATNSITAKIDDSQKTTLNSVTTLGSDVIAKTCETVKNNVPDPGQVLRSTGDMLRRTAETCSSALHSTAAAPVEPSEPSEPAHRAAKRGRSKQPAGASGEPQAAADVLAG